MAKMNYRYFGLDISAEGEEKFLENITDKILAHAAEDYERSGAAEAEELPCIQLSGTVHIAGAKAEHNVVAIYDNAGIPSIMHRFRRVSNKDLFGGEDKPHPAFVIGGEVVDKIYISVYQNTMINGKPYDHTAGLQPCRRAGLRADGGPHIQNLRFSGDDIQLY